MTFAKTIGGSGQRRVYGWLCRAIGKPKCVPYDCAWDFEVNGLRIEVKTSVLSKGQWRFNFHRHGILAERADVYILLLEGCPYWRSRIYLVVPSPIKRKTLYISPRSLAIKWGRHANDLKPFRINRTKRAA